MARLFLLLFVIFSFSGCSQFKRDAVSEEKDPHFLEARKRAKAMDWDGAIEYFERALQNNPTNASAHFELGVLYDSRKADFGTAIYHYQRHAKLRPNSPTAERAGQNIIACKRELAKTASLEYVPRDLQKELERHAGTNALLSEQVRLLKTELARRPQYVTNYVTNFVKVPVFEPGGSSRLTQPAALVEAPVSDSVPDVIPEPDLEPQVVERTPPPKVRTPSVAASSRNTERSVRPAPATRTPAAAQTSGKTHRVRPGDTLEVIARRYGVSVTALKAANPSARSGARAGQQLVIPAR